MNTTDPYFSRLEAERVPDVAQMDIKEFLSDIKEVVRYHEWCEGKGRATYCQVCYELISGSAYVYTNFYAESLAVHKTCGDSPYQIQHPLHPDHPLEADHETLSTGYTQYGGFICSGCRHFRFGFCYGCSACDFKLDFQCASNLKIQHPEEFIEIKTDFHDHKLQRFYHHTILLTDPRYLLLRPFEENGFLHDICCSCCAKGFKGSGLACSKCYLFIHDSCVHKVPFPEQIISPFHLEHPLVLQLSDDHIYNLCTACQLPLRPGDLILTCEKDCTTKAFHVSCGTQASSGLRLEKYDRKHPMMCVYLGPASSPFFERPCVVCNSECELSLAYSCFDCDVYVHSDCIPLPSVVKHKCHSYEDHTLVLSDLTNLPDFSSSGEDYCTLCERKVDFSYPYYHCLPCSEIAHLNCILNEEDPPSQILEYLVPRPVENFQNCSAQPSFAAPDKESTEEEKESKGKGESDLEGYGVEDIDSEIATIQLRLKTLRTAREKKIGRAK